MIEDKKIGLKMAEDDNELFWTEVLESRLKDVENLEKMLKYNYAIILMCENHLAKYARKGGKKDGKKSI